MLAIFASKYLTSFKHGKTISLSDDHIVVKVAIEIILAVVTLELLVSGKSLVTLG